MAVTIIDVAKKAGVSPSTVSRVLSGYPRISPKTSQRVREVIEELGYHPNVMAKSLVSKTTSTLGLILPRPAEELFLNLFFAEIIRRIVTQAARAGYDVLMTAGSREHPELDAVTRLVNSHRVDGLILLHSRKHDPVISFLTERGFPFVLIGRNEDYPDILSVDNDNIQAAYDATRHLISQGHQRIGFVSGPPDLFVSKDRLSGYQMAMKEEGIKTRPEWIVEGEFLQESGYRAMSFFMSLPERPTALVVIDDLVAIGVLHGLGELGYEVPKDLGIISFNNLTMSELSHPPISSVDIGIYQIGHTASQTLIRYIRGEPFNQNRFIVPHRLIVRQSSLSPVQSKQ